MRLLNLCVLVLLVLAAAYVYEIKFESTLRAERVAKMRGDVQRERDAIAALRAEWTTLENPARIQGLARRHLKLQPAEATQYDALDRLPERAADGRAAAARRRDRRHDRRLGIRCSPAACRRGGAAAMTATRQPLPCRDDRERRPKPAKPRRRAGSARCSMAATSIAPPRRAPASVLRSWPLPRSMRHRCAPRHVRGGAGKPFRAPRRVPDAVATARPDILDRNGLILATDVRAPSLFARAAQDHRRRRSDRAFDRRAARPRLDRSARPPRLSPRLRLAQARDHAQAAAGNPQARPARRRLPRREQARLSEQRRSVPPDRSRQHRQPGHRRHREMARRPWACRRCIWPGSPPTGCRSRSNLRSIFACSMRCATS